MEKNSLLNIQDAVIRYAEIMAQVSGVNVEVVDRNFIRIAGTGIFSENIGKSMEKRGFIYKRVMDTGRRHVIENPAKDDICRMCSYRSTCQEKFEIVTPIILDKSVEGIIALIATSEKQKHALTDRLDMFLGFIEQIADFISVKAKEFHEVTIRNQYLNTLSRIVDNVNQCVIVINRDNAITSMNPTARKHLDNKDNRIGQPVVLQETGDTINGSREYKMEIDGRLWYVAGSLFEFRTDVNATTRILIFQERNQLRENVYSMTSFAERQTVDDIVGSSRAIVKLRESICRVAKHSSTVLITGESGTGKEMVATAIWKASQKRNQTFVPINCAAIPDALLESELFGYVKGAFSGADPNGRIGKFELANRGIIFLDEIGDMPIYLQAKLLRVLQEKKITRIGSNNQIDIDVRIIAATNKDLSRLITENKFREDLYYRLKVIPLSIPPLRERKEDIEELVFLFINRYSQRFGKFFRLLDKNVLDALRRYDWPGNIRELENVVEFMINMMNPDGVIDLATLPASILSVPETPEQKSTGEGVVRLDALERREILRAIALYGEGTEGKKIAAEKLGIGVATLYRKLDRYKSTGQCPASE